MKNKLFIVILTRSETLQEIATLDILVKPPVFDLKNTVTLAFSSNGKTYYKPAKVCRRIHPLVLY